MPPQARSKRPSSSALHLGRAGGMVGDDHVDGASRSPCQSSSRFAPAANGRSALEQGRAVGDLLCREVQVVRAGLDRDRQAFLARGLQFGKASAVRDARCAAGSRTRGRAGSSGGWLATRPRQVARRDRLVLAPVGVAQRCEWRRRSGPASSAWTSRGRPDSAMAGSAAPTAAVDHGEAVAAGIDEEALEAADSGARQRKDVCLVVSHCSAPAAQSMKHSPFAAARFASSAATVVVSGRQFSGMSTSVV